MNNDIIFKSASISDFDYCWNAILEIVINSGTQLHEYDNDHNKNMLNNGIINNNVLTANINNNCIGFIWYSKSDTEPYGIGNYGKHENTFLWINYLFVSENFRHKGIATKLYIKVEEYCIKNNIKEILLDVFENNTNSIKFHNNIGFNKKIGIYSKNIG